MQSKILLINFSYKEQETIGKLGINVDLGYMSDAFATIDAEGKEEELAKFYSPLAIYEYQVVLVKLTSSPPLESAFLDKAKIIRKEDRANFFKYWRQKGVLIVFLEDNKYVSFINLGIPYMTLRLSSGRDATTVFVLNDENRPFRQIFRSEMSLITMPPRKYINVEKREGSYDEGNWYIFDIYENLNDEAMGVYHNAKPSYSDEDVPSFVVLPAFKDYTSLIIKLLKSLARIYPKHIPEIFELDWVESDKYYPREVTYFDEQIKSLVESTKTKVEEFKGAKQEAKIKYAFLRSLLTAAGDDLKDAVIKALSEIWKLDVEDMDASRKTDFREDILIKEGKPHILGEIKGTQNQNPTLNHVVQLLSHLQRSKQKNAIGALILNHDLKRDPEERNDAYTKPEEEGALREIIYIDTRVLFRLSIAILDYGLHIEEAKKILFNKGRVIFDLDQHIKSQLGPQSLKKKE